VEDNYYEIPSYVGTEQDSFYQRFYQRFCDCLAETLDVTDRLLTPLIHRFLYNPKRPEFSELQLTIRSILIGVVMGVYVFLWKKIIEGGLDFVWKTIPDFLHELGIFTDLGGLFPLYHCQWIIPSVLGGALSYAFAEIPLPDQNDWIKAVHSRGVIEYSGFWKLFVLSTLGMLSGLSLGPELPLILTGSMFGSWVAVRCNQSVIQSRILTLTGASAAVAGFFHFPMGGALFVLELVGRMGVEHPEAIGPAILASMTSVLVVYCLSTDDVVGLFHFPSLPTSLPWTVLPSAFVYGLFGCAAGVAYLKCTKSIKAVGHDLFQAPSCHIYNYINRDATTTKTNIFSEEEGEEEEQVAPCGNLMPERMSSLVEGVGELVIPHRGTRAAVVGVIAGALVGIICIFVPHVMFWGEGQMQNLINRGLSPLPLFGEDGGPTSAFVAHGFCMVDPSGAAGFGMGCSLLIAGAKTVVVGLSLATGILGGHFWGPLFVGCALSHFLTDAVNAVAPVLGFGGSLVAYPTIVMLCVMGGAHVVTFRAWMAISIILMLSMMENTVLLCLLVIAVYVARTVSGNIVFYKEQRHRNDIIAVPEVLCRPGKEGTPLAPCYKYSSLLDAGDSDEECGGLPQRVWSSSNSTASSCRSSLLPVPAFGYVTDGQPSLLEQARMRSASFVARFRSRSFDLNTLGSSSDTDEGSM
jgi:H+/Cl- antiporter ClcA